MAGGLFTMGAYHDANEYVPLLGYFDEVRVWNTALSASQLHSYACIGVTTPIPFSLLGYWKFDENQGGVCANSASPFASAGVLISDIKRVADAVC